uniref:RWD domain-containing protein n=1 Tax=Arcella intermedia TaxID=1963864 RepID=A0A6B2KXK2_9EUKA
MNPTGEFAAFGGKKGLYIVPLNEPKLYKSLSHKWDISLVEWNPHSNCIVASTANSDVLIWDVESRPPLTTKTVFTAHTRTVSDICWSPHDAPTLATCSADSYVRLWDLRNPKSALKIHSYCCWNDGLTRVKWNPYDPYEIASTQNGTVNIWDIRKEQVPKFRITAHMNTITGIDWFKKKDGLELMTCAGESKIKFWSMRDPQNCHQTLNMGVPVFRAQYTPFGYGIVAYAQRSDYSIKIYYGNSFSRPPVVLQGHSDMVPGISWKTIGGKEGKPETYQLYSWGKDQNFCCWELAPAIWEEFKEDEVHDIHKYLSTHGMEDMDLEQEVARLRHSNIPGIMFQELNTTNRTCLINANVKEHSLSLRVLFPKHYPNNAPPSFHILHSNLQFPIQSMITKSLSEIAQFNIEKHRACLCSCLEELSRILKQSKWNQDPKNPVSQEAKSSSSSNGESSGSSGEEEIKVHKNIPFPRLSGASFCGNGFLLRFKTLPNGTTTESVLNIVSPRAPNSHAPTQTMMRTFDDYNLLIASLQKFNPSFLYLDGIWDKMGNNGNTIFNNLPSGSLARVIVYDLSSWLGLSRPLAEKYITNGDVTEICKKNEEAARAVRRRDLVETWRVLQSITHPSVYFYDPEKEMNEFCVPWGLHPFGKQLVQNLIRHYEDLKDIQTLALIVFILTIPIKAKLKAFNNNGLMEGISARTCSNDWNTKLNQLENQRLKKRIKNAISLLESDPLPTDKFNQYLMCYAEILERWGLFDKRLEILDISSNKKILEQEKVECEGIDFKKLCLTCNLFSEDTVCKKCKSTIFQCSICNLPLKGQSIVCFICGHGGHPDHIIKWFSESRVCPVANCECCCYAHEDDEFYFKL